jgi:hypothetical protein
MYAKQITSSFHDTRCFSCFLNHQYMGTEVSINAIPSIASRGRLKTVFKTRPAEKMIKIAGTTG